MEAAAAESGHEADQAVIDVSLAEQIEFLKWAGGGIAGGLTLAVVHLYRRDSTCRGELSKYRLALARLLDFVSGTMDSERRVIRRPTEAELFNPDFNINSLFETAPHERRRQIREASKKLPMQKDHEGMP